MGTFWKRRGRLGRARARPLEVTPLEDRLLLTITRVTAMATPGIVAPSGRYVTITITGQVGQQITDNIGHTTAPPPKKAALDAYLFSRPGPMALVQVTDEYRSDEPQVRIALTETGHHTFFNPSTKATPIAVEAAVRDYSYTATVKVRARLGANIDERQYSVTVAATDADGYSGYAGTTLGVQVLKHAPHSQTASHGTPSRFKFKKR